MANISKKNKELYDLGEGDNLIEFDLINPTTSDVTYNLFNTTTLSLVPTVPNPVLAPSFIGGSIAVGNAPQGIAFNPISNTMYVCNALSATISVIDCVTNTVVTTIILPVSFPQRIAYCSANNTMYIGNAPPFINGNNVFVIDCNTNTLVATIIGSGVALAYNPINNKMYCCRNLTGVSVIDCNTNTFTTIVTPNCFNIAYNSLSNTMYFTTGVSGTVIVIDCVTNTIIGSVIIGVNSVAIEYNSLNNTMYVSNPPLSTITVVNCNTNTVISTITTSGNVSLMIYVPLFNFIYFSNNTLSTVDVIDCNTNLIINSISIFSVRFLSYNSLTNSVYTTNQSTANVTLISAPPQVAYITGSFNYNEFIQDVINNPVCVERLILVSQQNTTNFNQVINVVYKDANGIETQNPFIPSLSVGTSQFQSGIGKVDFLDECLVLGVNQYFLNFTNYALSTVKVLLIYKQLEKSKLLTNKKGMCGKLEFKCNPLQTYKPTKNDAAFDYFHIIPIKPTKPTIRPFSIKDIVPTKPIKDVVPIKPIKDIRTEVKPDVRTDVKPDVKTDVKTDIKTDTKPSIKPLRVSYFSIYGGGGQRDITCGACEWSWNRNESDADDVYVCHKCGYDNQKIYQNEKFRV